MIVMMNQQTNKSLERSVRNLFNLQVDHLKFQTIIINSILSDECWCLSEVRTENYPKTRKSSNCDPFSFAFIAYLVFQANVAVQ